MKVLILSDLHAEFVTFKMPTSLDYDVAILAGDISSPGRVVPRWLRHPDRFGSKPVVVVAGNHEYYDTVMARELAEMRRAATEHGVHFLDGDEVVIADVRFLGCTLWTDFDLRIEPPASSGAPQRQQANRRLAMLECQRYVADYTSIRLADPQPSNTLSTRRLTPIDTLMIHRRHRSWLRRKLAEPFDGRTVVVTHHAPHRGSLAPRFAEDWSSGAFVSELPPEFFAVPQLWVHGHTHDSFDYQVAGCRVVCNPRGYRDFRGELENAKFDPRLVIDLERGTRVEAATFHAQDVASLSAQPPGACP
jgi:Icc-related predicted phosphoesterase